MMKTVKEIVKRERQKGRRRVGIMIVLIALCATAIFFGTKAYHNYKEEEFFKSVKEKEIKVTPKSITHKQTDIFTQSYQKETDDQLKALKKGKNYTFNKPLIVWNAYGTYTTSLYYYAKNDRASYAVCTVEASEAGASPYKRTLKSVSGKKYVTTHEYQIKGLVPGAKNKITMQFFNEDGRAVGKTHFYVTALKDDVIPAILKKNTGTSKAKMSDGLFCLFGHDKADVSNIYLYDNNGVSRGRMPLNKYRTDRFLFIKGQLVYSYDYNKIAFTNCIGKVTRTIDIGNYQFHHDFRYDKKHDKIICLVNNLDKDTIEDTIVQVDIKTGKTSMLFDCEKILPLMRKLAIQRKGGRNTYGGTELDWIHINSFDFLDDGNSLVLSSREQSSILKIKNIYTKPELDYVIHRGTIYNGTDIAKYQLKREGDFVANAGQHMITVEYDDSLPEGQYYLYMFNNNYGRATSIPTFDWSMYPNVGNFKSGTSYYSKFLVDEKTRTYKLAQQFSLPYSAIVSSVQHLGGNIPFSSGMSKIFGEYDKDGKLIQSFEYEADKLAEGIDILTMLVDSKLCTTRSDARRMVQQGGVSVNGKKVDAIDATFGKADFDDKNRILLKKGKKKFCQIKEK